MEIIYLNNAQNMNVPDFVPRDSVPAILSRRFCAWRFCAQKRDSVPERFCAQEILCLIYNLVPGTFRAWGDFVPSKNNKNCVSNFVPGTFCAQGFCAYK